ncbi:MAG: hypothetical protein WBL87_04100 [Methanothrix sp.]
MRLVSFYLIACSLLLASCAAEDYQYDSMDDVQELDASGRPIVDPYGQATVEPFEIDIDPFDDQTIIEPSNGTTAQAWDEEATDQDSGDQMSSEDYQNSLYDSYSQIPNVQEVTSLALPVPDLSGDRASDLLLINISSQAETEDFNSSISAISGADGSTLWQKDYPGSLVYAMTAGDVNGNGLTDVMVDQVLAGEELSLSSSVSIFDGSNGNEIWSRPQTMAMTIAYPVKDSDGDDAPDMVVHTFHVDGMNGSLSTRIARVSGASGTDIDEKTFIGSLAVEYPAGNLTADGVPDRIIAIYQLNGSMSGELEDDLMNITATTLEAIDGQGAAKLWEQSFDGPAMAVPLTDLTGDGMDDLAAYLIRYGEDASITNDMALLQGSDGAVLWQKSFPGFMAIGVSGADQTGEGLKDMIIYKVEGSEEVETVAFKGDDGRQLWNRTGMIYLPTDLLGQELLSFLPASL